MQYLRVKNVAKRYGEKLLFENVSFTINEGEKVALVAANGTGKSSLVRAMAGIEPADAGDISFAKDIRVAFLMQDPDIDVNKTILENVLYAKNDATQAILNYEIALANSQDEKKLTAAVAAMDASHAWDYETRVKQILFTLNITQIHESAAHLSGGEKKRIALAKLLVNNPDFLILDEPTNHLDLEMIEWLEDWLIQSNITLLLITHDRYFLENVCNRIIELENGLIYSYSGNYSDYLEKKEARIANEQANIAKAKNLMRTELEWMRRMPKARGTKSKARIESFYELKKNASKKINDEEITLEINPERLGSKILELHNVSKSYGERVLFEHIDYKFKRYDKLGIIGKNGSGKSTFLKTILGKIEPDTGKVVVGETVKFGLYSQEGMTFKEGMRVIEVVRAFGEYIPLKGGGKITASQLLEKFLFPSYMHYVHVSKLSGGEKRRLYLLTVLIQNPNFLILDEPTNDLDLITLNVLEDFLASFSGCLIIVTHDRFFMDKLVDHVFVFGKKGKVADFPGNYTQYRLKQKEVEQLSKEIKKNQDAKVPDHSNVSDEKLSYEERKQYNRLEKEIEKLEKEVELLHTDMETHVNDYEKLNELNTTLKKLQEKIDDKTMKWLELSERA